MVEKYNDTLAYVNKNEQAIINDMRIKATKFLEENFDMTLDIPITLNGRLKRSLGRFRLHIHGRSIGIEMSKILVVQSILEDNEQDLDGTLYHELVHYALFEKGLPYRDVDREFINTCNNLDVPLTRTIRIQKKVHVYKCEQGHTVSSNNKFNENSYVCAKCKSKLEYKGIEIK